MEIPYCRIRHPCQISQTCAYGIIKRGEEDTFEFRGVLYGEGSSSTSASLVSDPMEEEYLPRAKGWKVCSRPLPLPPP